MTTHLKKSHPPVFRKSLLALAMMGLCATASGQDKNDVETAAEEDETEVIQVKGMRSNITESLHLKRYASTVIDSITADDIGGFPDKSVAEALQRVPGITVERFGSRTDTKAFSVEPSGVLVRGLGFVRSEFNGRDSFSANSSRGLSWGDVSPELMGGVDVYKSQTAELIEGGIAGLINLRTRLPFDSENDVKVVTVKSNYNELSDSNTAELSGVYTTRWNTDMGEFGFMANMAYSDLDATAQTSRGDRVLKFRGAYGDMTEEDRHFLPQGFFGSDSLYSRQRLGASIAAQWQDSDGEFLATFQYNRSQKEQDRMETGISVGLGNPFYQKSLQLEATPDGDGSNVIVQPVEGADPISFDEQGLFQSAGPLTAPSGGWQGNPNNDLWTANSNGERLIPACYAWAGCTGNQGLGMGTSGLLSNNDSVNEDLSANLKWNISDTVHANFDVQYIQSTYESYDIRGSFASHTNPEIDASGEQIDVVLHAPSMIPLLDAGQGIYANPNNYRFDNIMDLVQDSEGTEFAARADLVFDVQNDFVEAVKVGVRYADREQNKNNAGNWASVTNTWSNSREFYNLDSPAADIIRTQTDDDGNEYDDVYHFPGYPDVYTVKELDFDYGSFTTADGNNLFVVPDPTTMNDWKNTMAASVVQTPGNQWQPICSNATVPFSTNPNSARGTEIPGTCFQPLEMIELVEESTAAYVQVEFGGDDFTLFDKQLSGNLGVRYVKTDIFSTGGESYPLLDDSMLECKDIDIDSLEPGQPIPEITKSLGCYLGAEDIAFSNGAQFEGNGEASHTHFLPSFNLKMDVTDNFVTRLAMSKAMSRPDIGALRNYIGVSQTLPTTDNPNSPNWLRDANGEINGANIGYSAKSNNPSLKPIVAKQVDLSFEYYSKATSVSLALFHKSFDDYIQKGTYSRELTNNGITKTIPVIGPINGDGAKFRGFEIQTTKWFDFLPGAWSGLGLQANYTYIDNEGLENTNVNSDAVSGDIDAGQAADVLEVSTLEGLSREAYNVVLMYQKHGFSARVAYNWRDEFLVTNSDCCIAYPVWQNDYGQVDANIRYKINETFEISLSAQNLTEEEPVLEQQVDDSSKGGLRLPYSINRSGRRYTGTITMRF